MTPLVIEYSERRRLAGLGFQFSADDLPAWKADCFTVIDQKRDEILRGKVPFK